MKRQTAARYFTVFIEGKTNRALIDFLAKQLGMKRSDVEIMSGHTNRVKTIKIVGEGTGIQKTIDMLVG